MRFRRRFSGTRRLARKLYRWQDSGSAGFVGNSSAGFGGGGGILNIVLVSTSAIVTGAIGIQRATCERIRGTFIVHQNNNIAGPNQVAIAIYANDDITGESSNFLDPTNSEDVLSRGMMYLGQCMLGTANAPASNMLPQGYTFNVDVKARRVLRNNQAIYLSARATNACIGACNLRVLLSTVG